LRSAGAFADGHLEEECFSAEEALDRWDELDARGIRADVFEVIAGARRKVRL